MSDFEKFKQDFVARHMEREMIAKEMTLCLAFALRRLGGRIEIPIEEIEKAHMTGDMAPPRITTQRSDDGRSVVVRLHGYDTSTG